LTMYSGINILLLIACCPKCFDTVHNMGLPQAGHDKLTSAFYRYCALAMGLTVY